MTKFLSDLIVKGVITADNGIVLGAGKNASTTNQFYLGATNYSNSIVVGWDASAVYLGYSMGSLPIHVGANGTGEFRVRSTGGVKIDTFAGTGSRMVVADPDGKLSVQAVPSFTEVDTLDSVTDRGAATTNYLTVGRLTVLAASGGAELFLNSTATGGGQWSIGSYSSVNTISNALGFYNITASTTPLVLTPTKLQMLNAYQLIWTVDDYDYADVGIPDAGLGWEVANTLKVTNASTGYGSIKALNVTATDSVYAKTKFTLENEIAELGTYDSGSGGANINSYLSLFSNNNDGYGDGIAIRYSRGSKASPSAVQAGDIAGGIYFKPYSNGVYATQSFIESYVTGVEAFAKTEMQFATSNGFNQGGFVWMTLKEDGKLHVASPTTWVDKGAYRLQIDGNIYTEGTANIRNGVTATDFGGVNTTWSLLASTGGSSSNQVLGVKNGAIFTNGNFGVFDNYQQPYYFYTNRGYYFIPANSRAVSTLDWIYAGGTMFIAGGNTNQNTGWVSIKPTFSYNGQPDSGTKYIGLYYSPTDYAGLGSQHYAIVAEAGKVQLGDLAGTGTRMVVADANGNLGVQSVPTGSLQGAVDADKNTSGSLAVGTTIVKSISATTYSGVFFDYVVKNGTNVRVGSVVAITNGTNIEFYETLSNDIGTTTALTFTVTLGSGNINLNAVAAATGWTVIVSTRAI